MRIVKLAVWIAALYVIQTVFGTLISIHGAVPELITTFSITYALLAENEKEAHYVIIICALLAGSCPGRVFPIQVPVSGCAALAARGSDQAMRSIPAYIRSASWSALAAFCILAAECLVFRHSITPGILLGYLLPGSLYTAAAAFAIYPLIKRTLFKKTEKKLLII